LQADDEDSKLMFNSVKNVTKSFQDSQVSDNKAKISNGFKCLISKIIREFVQMLSYKIQVYLSDDTSNQIRLSDIKKIVRMCATLDCVDEFKTQMDAFDASVHKRIEDIESARQVTRSKSQQAPSSAPL
jgi:hypothetical protein